MYSIDLNCDMGESYGAYTLGADDRLMPLISSANIACGWHAGDPLVMSRTVESAIQHKVAVGAHPGYPDLLGFGRRPMDCSLKEIRAYVMYQVGALQAFCKAGKIPLRHVKPHGALYNSAAQNEDLLRVIAEAVAGIDPDIYLVTLAKTSSERTREICRQAGVKVMFEAFADRAYTPQGTLVPRSHPNAIIHSPEAAAEQVIRIVTEGKLRAVDGSDIALDAQTICVHGDTPEAVNIVRRIRRLLESSGIVIQRMAAG
ncbi:MAG: 5-oxoprolinase subunit PxpA [Desulfobacteraceae bacterium]|nr:MAG: 5-oxoprolinase subunit PxpA [Desulfobacteraceae bacterium]